MKIKTIPVLLKKIQISLQEEHGVRKVLFSSNRRKHWVIKSVSDASAQVRALAFVDTNLFAKTYAPGGIT